MDNTMALLLSDTYKQCHDRMYPKGLTKLVSYWVPRKSMLEKQNKMVFFGLQAFIKKFLLDYFKENFFDLSEEEAIKEGIKSIITEKKPIDIVVNNAGVAYGGLLQMTTMETLKDVYQVNYFAPVQITQMVSRVMMKQRSGSIINVASVGGIEAEPGYLAYGSSKASLIWTTRMLANELGDYGIRVNAVAPGTTDTKMGHFKNEEALQNVLGRTSLGRMAKPEEIAEGVWFLASDASAYITGDVLKIDGGRTA